MNESKIIKIGTLLTKIFLIGLLIQFLVQTFVMYKLHQDNWFWNVIWMWKEIILIVILCGGARFLWKRRIVEARRKTLPIKKFALRFCITILIAFIVSVFINQTGLGIFIVSMRYSMMGFFIFILFFGLAYLFFGTREFNLVKRYARIIKTLLICSIFWRGIIWLMPNLLRHVGYNPFNYEGAMGIAPPVAYYTQFDSGYVRNQFLFERPISRGFFLIAFWPLFFVICMKKKSIGEKILRGGFYGIALLSTFSRAAWIARIVQIALLILMQFERRHWKMLVYRILPVIVISSFGVYVGRDQIINREFSNNGHIKLIVSALRKVAERPFRGQGAGYAGPASFYLGEGQSYNPENQYLQIRLEYGIFGFAGWLYLYRYLHWIGYKAYLDEKEQKKKLIKKTKQYSLVVFAFSLGLLGLSIEGLVLHSFVDRMIVYPFMALFGIAYALYRKSLNAKG